MAGMRHSISQCGFTLLEVVVVMTILAIVAGTTFRIFSNSFLDDTKETFVKYEMQQIRDALIQYKRDNNSFPDTADLDSPVDISFLHEQGTEGNWSPDYLTGWRGPYLSTQQFAFVDIGDNLIFDGTGDPLVTMTDGPPDFNPIPINDVVAIADVYSHSADIVNESSTPGQDCSVPNNDFCILEWHAIANDNDTRIDLNGRPYLFFELNDTDRARIVSMGPDGLYDNTNIIDPCVPEGDDYVVCLY